MVGLTMDISAANGLPTVSLEDNERYQDEREIISSQSTPEYRTLGCSEVHSSGRLFHWSFWH